MKYPSQVRVTGPLGPYAEGFRAELARQGYASSSAVSQLKLVGHLSRWMTIEGLWAPELVPAEIERYVVARRAARYRHNLSGQGLRPLLEYLRGLGVLAGPAPPGPATPHERLLEDYASYLVAERSLAAGTVRYYLRFARLFISSVSDQTGPGLDAITTGDVSRFVVEQCGRRAGHGAALAAAVLPRDGPQRDPAGRCRARGRPVARASAPARPQPGRGGAAAWQLRSTQRHRPARLRHLGRAATPGTARRRSGGPGAR